VKTHAAAEIGNCFFHTFVFPTKVMGRKGTGKMVFVVGLYGNSCADHATGLIAADSGKKQPTEFYSDGPF